MLNVRQTQPVKEIYHWQRGKSRREAEKIRARHTEQNECPGCVVCIKMAVCKWRLGDLPDSF